MNIVVITLILVLLNPNHSTRVETHQYMGDDAMTECKLAEQDARAAAVHSDLLDVGTLCVRSEFDDNLKPRV